MIKWIRTSRLSIKNSFSYNPPPSSSWRWIRLVSEEGNVKWDKETATEDGWLEHFIVT